MVNFFKLTTCSLLLLMTLSQTVSAQMMTGANNPRIMDENFELTLSRLPKSASLTEGYAWPSYYWANNRGGIAFRWNTANPQNFKYTSPSLAQLKMMNTSEINSLSPAEKYDIFMSNYAYPTVKKNWGATSRRHPEWYGICHGMASAAVHHQEPDVVTVTNNEGIEITFYTSDLKALMGHYYARESNTSVRQVGLSCNRLGAGRACKDVNAGAFHVIMTNQLGIKNESFVADIDRKHEKWNHAAFKFETQISSPRNSNESGVNSEVVVNTTIHFAGSVDPHQSPLIGREGFDEHVKNYRYKLFLNNQGEIIGGSWLSTDHPDFLWRQEKDEFKGYFSGLNLLYKPAI
jgi:hypothetical protein